MSKIIIGVIGPGESADENARQDAFELGRLIAREGWVLLTGGRAEGVMHAASAGAREAGGITLGILAGEDRTGMSAAVDIPIVTGIGQARNNVNILSSDVLIACGMSAGTASEVALAIQANKTVVLLGSDETSAQFFARLGGSVVLYSESPELAVQLARKLLCRGGDSSTAKLDKD